jgi:hypothetical protein
MKHMKIRRMILWGVLVLFLLTIVASLTAAAEQNPSPTIVVQPGEGVEFHDMSDGTEPPPHVVILNKDGSLARVVPNHGEHP